MKLVLAITGGGSEAIPSLLSQGGASDYFLEGIVPYNQKALDSFLGFSPEKYCSNLTARQMAMQAFRRAISLGASKDEAKGVGVTCTLAKQGQERPDRVHEFYIATQTNDKTECSSFRLNIKYPRSTEEKIVGGQIYMIIKEGHPTYVGNVVNGLSVESRRTDDLYNVKDVITGGSKVKVFHSGKELDNQMFRMNPVIYPGSFNPIHEGHIDIIKWCNKHLGCKPYLEISVKNPDKPPLDYIDIYERKYDVVFKTSYVEDHKPHSLISGIILSNTPRFFDKSWMYMQPTFLVGSDTFNRILDLKYYQDSKEFENFVDHVKVNKTQFYVLDRKGSVVDNSYIRKIGLDHLVHMVPSTEYEDKGVSSTQIRRQKESLW